MATELSGFTQPCSDIICVVTSVTTQCVFFLPRRSSLPPQTNHPYVITCGTGEKTTYNVGNSASKPFKRTLTELLAWYNYRLMENCVDKAPCILEMHSN